MIFKKKKIKLVEGFAGIGAIHMSLEKNGIEVDRDNSIVIEWNIYSIIAYASLHYNDAYIKKKDEVNSDLKNLKPDKAKEYIKEALSSYYTFNKNNNGTETVECSTLSSDGKTTMTTLPRTDIAIKLIAAVSVINHKADISKYSYEGEKENVDLFWQSSPCQNFSLAGNREGGDEGSGTSSSLLYEAIRLVGEMEPKVVIWENVGGVLSPKNRPNFDKYIEVLESFGYTSNFIKIKGTDLGHPQNRTRIFVYSYKNNQNKLDLSKIFKGKYDTIKLENIIDFSVNSHEPSKKGVVHDRNFELACEHLESKGLNYKDYNFLFDAGLSPSRGAKASLGTCPTLLTSKRVAKYSKYLDKYTLLTAKEYWALMGFDVSKYELVEGEILESQIYKICGNSVLVNQIDAIISLGISNSNT